MQFIQNLQVVFEIFTDIFTVKTGKYANKNYLLTAPALELHFTKEVAKAQY